VALTRQHLHAVRDLELVYPLDPSVDKKKSDFKKYTRTGDRSHLVTDGKETVFHCRTLSGPEWKRMKIRMYELAGPGGFQYAFSNLAFETAMSRISNVELDDGTVGELPREKWDEFFDDDCRTGIGGMIVLLSNVNAWGLPESAEEGADHAPLSQPPSPPTPSDS